MNPVCSRGPATRMKLGGFMAEYLEGITEQWLLVAPTANPSMLEMFRDRDASPLRHLVPWAGEFAGKYLTGAVQVLRVTGDRTLKASLKEFVPHLLSLQGKDGYLGPWPSGHALTNHAPNSRNGPLTWDTWGHYHVMLGLILWHEETGDLKALAGATRIGDLLCRTFLGKKKPRLVDTGSTEMNLAPAHSLCMLYRQTKNERYLKLARQVVDEFAARSKGEPLAGDYLRQALAGREFFQTPKPRWESLHPIMALAELHWITGDDSYREAFEQIWWSIVKLDRHNNGGFSSGEQATGNPFHLAAIETCCTIAWMAMSVEMLKLTGNALVADELELSTYNSVLGMHSSTGRWCTYNTPMNGLRRCFTTDHNWQAREGSPELNCCSVNSSRGFGVLSDWALMSDSDGLILNYYGPSVLTARVKPGVSVTLTQETKYPLDGKILIHVKPTRPAAFALKLRIPGWSARTSVRLNGKVIPAVQAGGYLIVDRRWKTGDRIQMRLDMTLHLWRGADECEGLASIYRGPLLLAYDHRYNLEHAGKGTPRVRDASTWDPASCMLEIPPLDAESLKPRRGRWSDWLPPLLLLEFMAADGRKVRLCDFGSAGEAGTPYCSWLPVRHCPAAAEFSRLHPLRSRRVGE